MTRPLTLVEPTSSDAPGATITLRVQGMHCAACAASIERELAKLPNVASVAVNFALARARVHLGGGAAKTPTPTATPTATEVATATRAIIQAIQGIGFEASDAGDDNQQLAMGNDGTSQAKPASTQPHEENIWLLPALACVLSLPVVIIAMAHGRLAAFDAPWAMGVQVLLTTCVIGLCGRTLLMRGLQALARRRPTMESLIALGTIASVAASALALVRTIQSDGWAHAHHAPVYFEAACVMLSFVLLGKAIEARALQKLTAGFAHLRELLPRTLLVVPRATLPHTSEQPSDAIATPASQVVTGDIVLVRAHERVPVDGTIVQGESELDTSALTGEVRPMHVCEGESVHSGAMNLSGQLHILAARPPRESTLAMVVDAAEQAHTSKAPIARTADAIAAWFVPAVVLLACITGGVWLAIGTREEAITHLLSVLLVACPCALGLATPTALLAHLGAATRKGVVFRDAASLEALASITRLILDKTGTLTQGSPKVLAMHRLQPSSAAHADGEESTRWIARLTLALQWSSTHPIAKGLRDWARAIMRDESVLLAKRVKVLPGKGTEGLVDGSIVQMGSLAWLAPDSARQETIEAAQAKYAVDPSATLVLLCVAHVPTAMFVLHDALREDAREAIASLAALRITPVLATGDGAGPAAKVAKELGIASVFSQQTPQDKLALVQQDQRVTAMLGDGINDAPALAGARVGIAIAHDGNDFAQSAAGVVVLAQRAGASLTRVIDAIAISRRTMRTIRLNLALAFGYNLLALPLAMGVFEPMLGWSLSPMIASGLMALSSISVVMSAVVSARASRSPTQ